MELTHASAQFAKASATLTHLRWGPRPGEAAAQQAGEPLLCGGAAGPARPGASGGETCEQRWLQWYAGQAGVGGDRASAETEVFVSHSPAGYPLGSGLESPPSVNSRLPWGLGAAPELSRRLWEPLHQEWAGGGREHSELKATLIVRPLHLCAKHVLPEPTRICLRGKGRAGPRVWCGRGPGPGDRSQDTVPGPAWAPGAGEGEGSLGWGLAGGPRSGGQDPTELASCLTPGLRGSSLSRPSRTGLVPVPRTPAPLCSWEVRPGSPGQRSGWRVACAWQAVSEPMSVPQLGPGCPQLSLPKLSLSPALYLPTPQQAWRLGLERGELWAPQPLLSDQLHVAARGRLLDAESPASPPGSRWALGKEWA